MDVGIVVSFRFIALWWVTLRPQWTRWNQLEQTSVQKQPQPCSVSAFLPHQTGWLQHNPGEAALVTPKTWAMTHTYGHLKCFQSRLIFFFFFPNLSCHTVKADCHKKLWLKCLDEQYQCTAVYILGRNPWLFCLREDSTPWQQHRKMVCLLAGVIETCLVLPGTYLSQRKPSYHYCHLKEMNATNHI